MKYLKIGQWPTVIILFCIFSFQSCQKPASDGPAGRVEGVHVLDDRLDLKLMVSDPDIVTPIGIAVDDSDRVYVLESHTHLPPKDYDGPNHDIIKIYEDTNGDGQWDKVNIFAEGILEGLNLAFSPDGHLYAVTSREVWVFYDRDGDGVSEEREKLLELIKPDYVYAHAAILSITFDTEGWMYIGRGNTGGAHWIFRGSDSSKVEGYGDGGNIMRAKTDGSQLEVFATGFWNPFDLKFDNYGRLLVADNDPDSRGPNRLVHAIPNADFGYKSLFGGSGIHPYLAWNGELPGTLPYAVALGEAPSGLLNANLARLPENYHDGMLCTIWEESRIVHIKMKDQGLSVGGETAIIVEGGKDFRPVAFATDSNGNIFFTDWVLRYYPNHGRGRIWKLAAKEGIDLLEQRGLYDRPIKHPNVEEMNRLLVEEDDWETLISNLRSQDPFVRHTAVMALAKGRYHEQLMATAQDPDPDVRLGVLLALKHANHPHTELLAQKFLMDPSLEIRRMAMVWAGTSGKSGLKPYVHNALQAGELTSALFETYLETLKLLQPAFLEAYRKKDQEVSKNIPRNLPENFIATIVEDPDQPAKMKTVALKYLKRPMEQKRVLLDLLKKEKNETVQVELIRTLMQVPDAEVAEHLLGICTDPNQPALLRAEALLALSRQPVPDWQQLLPLLHSEDENIRLEAARYLQSRTSEEEVKSTMQGLLNKEGYENNAAFRQQLVLAVRGQNPERPANHELDKWQELLDGPGDRERGRRVFFSNSALCSTCHAVDNRGGDLGPDLSNVGQSKDRRGLISSILLPSEEISPEWQGWYIKLNDGTLYEGRQIDVGNDDIKLFVQGRGFVSVDKKDVSDYGLVPSSLMPEGLEQRLTDQDLKDLLAFLGNNLPLD